MKFEEKLKKLNVGKVSFSEPLKNHCSWKIGGPADALVQPCTEEQVLRLIAFVENERIPLMLIGRGTNLLFSDDGVRGVVLKLGRFFSGFSISGQIVKARGGIWVPLLVKNLADAGLSGMEHAAGIPGSFGGLVAMNGGSLRRSVGENIVSVEALSLSGEKRIFSADECGFSYRRSFFQTSGETWQNRWIVLEAVMELTPDNPETIRREQLRILAERKKKFPLHQPSCGSVFTNNPAVYELAGPPGRIIEETGLKGKRIGGAQISPVHANFIVNLGDATSRDVLSLIGEVRRRVHDRIGVWLECEVRYADERGILVPASEACG